MERETQEEDDDVEGGKKEVCLTQVKGERSLSY